VGLRSTATLCVFAAGAVVALKYPLLGLGMCCRCLILYLNPEAPGQSSKRVLEEFGLRTYGRDHPWAGNFSARL